MHSKKQRHFCTICNKLFMERTNLTRHIKEKNSEEGYKCDQCAFSTQRYGHLKEHVKAKHTTDIRINDETMHHCTTCNYQSNRPANLKRHYEDQHEKIPQAKKAKVVKEDVNKEVQKILSDLDKTAANNADTNGRQALGGEVKEFKIFPQDDIDPIQFLNNSVTNIEGSLNKELEGRTGVKLMIKLHLKMFKPTEPEEIRQACFRHKTVQILKEDDKSEAIKATFPEIYKALEKYMKEGSGWAVHSIRFIELTIVRYAVTRGSTYQPIPEHLRAKKAIINVTNNDDKCFMWSVLAALHKVSQHAQRVSKYRKHENELSFEGIEFPVKINDITKFENRNGLAINVYGYDDDLFPLRISKATSKPWIHLFLYKGHYSLIRSLDRLLSDQRRHDGKKYFCPRCLIPKHSAVKLDDHLELCCSHNPVKTVMPEDTIMKFKNYHKMCRQSKVIIGDFECLIQPVDTSQPNPDQSYTQLQQRHIPCGYGLVEVTGCCSPTLFSKPSIYRGPKAVQFFLQEVTQIGFEHAKDMRPGASMVGFDKKRQNRNWCHICNETIRYTKEKKRWKVADHCHKCGKYRGPANSDCNLKYSQNTDIVVIFHNLRKYDGHLLMQQIGDICQLQGMDLSVIPKSSEDYMAFSIRHKKERAEKPKADGFITDEELEDVEYKIRFIDSFQFMGRSLADLVKNLEKEQFKAMQSQYQGRQLELLLRKGVYPYEYMDRFEKFLERQLPPKEQFYSRVIGEEISDADYQHATMVWQTFNINSLGEYHDLYLATDVLLLEDVFEQFRLVSLKNYQLDPCHYVSAPALSLDACLLKTKVEIELLTNQDMYLFFEKGKRGGISQISHRYARANDHHLSDYDSAKPETYLMYWDANNLYGWAMIQPMPISGFRWMEKEEIEDVNWMDVPDDNPIGHVLEVDLDYPQELHDAHDQYPLAPEHAEIPQLSPYCENLKESLKLKIPKQKKLLTTLWNKKKYVLHYRNLKLYLELGLKLRKIHRVIEFKQRAWMKEYIMLNTSLRQKAKNSFEKDFFKLMNNSMFGKTLENIRAYMNMEMATSYTRHRKLAANPRYESSIIFTENRVGVNMLKPSVCLNKPIFCGFSVLDLSKLLMYEFHYKYVVPKYGSNAKLLFTDTDSLCYEIQTEDIYKDMEQDSDLFDFSDYPKGHFLQSDKNKKVIGKMKDELAGIQLIALLGLRPKMYATLDEKGMQKKTTKGIKKSVVKKQIDFQDYYNVLFGSARMKHQMTVFRSHLHQIGTEQINKTSLSPYDDKRWLLDNINSRAYGHYLN